MENSMKGVVAASLIIGGGAIAFVIYKRRKNKPEIITMDDAMKMREAIEVPFKEVEAAPEAKVIFDEELIDEDEEEKKLKKGTDPNSDSALEQYINMQTAIFRPNSNTDLVLRMLYGYPFRPMNTGDKVMHDALVDSRAEFFGPNSKWVKHVTWADVVLSYSEKLGYNLEEDMIYWTNYILQHLALKCNMSAQEVETLLEMLSTHSYVNDYSGYFGLFGLDDDAMASLAVSLEHSVEKKYTFEYEFQSFLKMAMRDEEEDED